jgi:hypothetical protein
MSASIRDIARAAGVPEAVTRSEKGWRDDKTQAIYTLVSADERRAGAARVVALVGGTDGARGKAPKRRKR